MDIATLSARFSRPGQLDFREVNGLAVLDINTPHGTASAALQGAHVMHWTPRGQTPVIWLSRDAKLAPGKSIRGGVPVCWPWFGAHEHEAAFPAHGFARTVPWELVDATVSANGARLCFRLPAASIPTAQWPAACDVSLEIGIGTAFEAVLTTRNTGSEAFTLGEALHTYFHVGDVTQVQVLGLEGGGYLDKADQWAAKIQSGPVTVGAEVDRLYEGSAAECLILDPALKRRIRVGKTGSHSNIVWNPWTEKAAKMGDLGPDGWREMLCVESANAGRDVIRLAPGASHSLAVRYSVEAL
jgi:D-hexose-6-phosphate mutarotase